MNVCAEWMDLRNLNGIEFKGFYFNYSHIEDLFENFP